MDSTITEDRKIIILDLFLEALRHNNLDDLAAHIDFCYDEFWYEMEADQIWIEQAELIGEDYSLPEELRVFRYPMPDWDFAESNLRQYGPTF